MTTTLYILAGCITGCIFGLGVLVIARLVSRQLRRAVIVRRIREL
jgi:hypothetical protein